MIPNLRDVGQTVNAIQGSELMHEGVLFRGGTVNELMDESGLPPVHTVLNLRTGEDVLFPTKRQIHVPAVDSAVNYHTADINVRNWANRVLGSICANDNFPLLVHCTAGKDRTGVIIALMLRCVGISDEMIVAEYMQTQGLKSDHNIRTALDGFGQVSEYLYQPEWVQELSAHLMAKSRGINDENTKI